MSHKTWNLIWHDEFDAPDIDLSRWRLEIGYTGETNGELEIYTARRKNAYIANGCLVIAARADNYKGYRYSSARLTTQGLNSWTYGRIEARIKIPEGQGLWPAFWMLGEDYATLGWPQCGEIDIMEAIGRSPDTVRGTVHGPGYFRDDSIGADFVLAEKKVADNFHVFAVEWAPNDIRWYTDERCYHVLTPSDVPGKWVFDHPFFILLNVAVGGHWPGYPDETTRFPQFMYVDYVRVYTRDPGTS